MLGISFENVFHSFIHSPNCLCIFSRDEKRYMLKENERIAKKKKREEMQRIIDLVSNCLICTNLIIMLAEFLN